MPETSVNSRLEAFCDGVFAIALTLLIIDIKIPPTENINTTAELWLALKHISPSIFSFILSFGVILITWVNHHNGLKLVNKSTGSFIYANGLLLLTVVFVPFPTSLLGEHILTDHAGPAVILYDSVLGFQAIGWILICRVALKNQLATTASTAATIHQNMKYGYFALSFYSVAAILAIWIPLAIALATAIVWVVWLIVGIRMKHD